MLFLCCLNHLLHPLLNEDHKVDTAVYSLSRSVIYTSLPRPIVYLYFYTSSHRGLNLILTLALLLKPDFQKRFCFGNSVNTPTLGEDERVLQLFLLKQGFNWILIWEDARGWRRQKKRGWIRIRIRVTDGKFGIVILIQQAQVFYCHPGILFRHFFFKPSWN